MSFRDGNIDAQVAGMQDLPDYMTPRPRSPQRPRNESQGLPTTFKAEGDSTNPEPLRREGAVERQQQQREQYKEGSYEAIGRERVAAAKERIASGFSSLKERVKGGLHWLAKKAGQGAAMAFAAPEMIADATYSAIGAGVRAQEAGNRALNTVAEKGKRIGNTVAETAGAIGKGMAAAAREQVADTRALVREGRDAIINKKDAIITDTRDAMGALSRRANGVYEAASGRVNAAFEGFNNWRNEIRLRKVARERIESLDGKKLERLIRVMSIL